MHQLHLLPLCSVYVYPLQIAHTLPINGKSARYLQRFSASEQRREAGDVGLGQDAAGVVRVVEVFYYREIKTKSYNDSHWSDNQERYTPLLINKRMDYSTKTIKKD